MTLLRQALRSGRVVLMDGAMGTELLRRGANLAHGAHRCTLLEPAVVEAIHREYWLAGAACLLTNTFQAQPLASDDATSCAELESVNRAAAGMARHVAGSSRFVLGAVGPPAEWWSKGKQERSLLLERSGAQVEWLSRTGLTDGLLLETQPSPEWALQLASLARQHASALPVIVSFAFTNHDGEPACDGRSPREIASAVQAREGLCAAIGVNCGRDVDLDAILKVMRGYREATDLPMLVRPNAGSSRVNDRWDYPLTPVRFAERVPELVDAGAALLGGCCGTTPEHVAAVRAVLERMNVLWQPTAVPPRGQS